MKLVARIELTKLLDQSELDQYRRAEQAMKEANALVLRAYNTSAEGSVLNKSGTEPQINIVGGYLTVKYKPLFNAVKFDVEEITKYDLRLTQAAMVPESVLNSLLHGKLLSEEEKRALLVDQGYIKEAKP